MGKLNQLSGIATNLADSLTSPTNRDFLVHIESLPIEKTKLFEIDLLKETITPEEISSDKVRDIIKNYKNWFISMIKKLKIELGDVEKVSIKVAYKPGKKFARYYNCNVTIKAKGKEYKGMSKHSYS